MTKKMIRAITGKYRDGILSIVANFIQKGTFLIVTIILANIFCPKLFGEYVFLKQSFDVLIVLFITIIIQPMRICTFLRKPPLGA